MEKSVNPTDNRSRFFEPAFPYPADIPTGFSQFICDLTVPFYIGLYFIPPKVRVCFWLAIALGTSMPKTPVHKDGELFLSESEVWLAG